MPPTRSRYRPALPHITFPRPKVPIRVIAKWIDYVPGPGAKKAVGMKKTHGYNLFSFPSSPLYVGAEVSILAASHTASHTPIQMCLTRYDTYDPHVQGKIVKASEETGGLITLYIVNECSRNAVDVVHLHVPNAPEVFTRLNQPDTTPSAAALEFAITLIAPSVDGIALPSQIAAHGECGGLGCRKVSVLEGLDLWPVRPEVADWEADKDVASEWKVRDEMAFEAERLGKKRRVRPPRMSRRVLDLLEM